MKKIDKKLSLGVLILLGSLILNACGNGSSEPTPTINPDAVRTEAVATFAAGLTQTAAALPANTPTNTPTDTPTLTPSRTNTPLTSGGSSAGSCYNLLGVRDVTIPDNTPMTPGEDFTKTWLVRNNGSCTWEIGFKFAFVGGDAMGGSTLVLDEAVKPGEEVELSVDMEAPAGSGAVRGNWRMSTANGTYFGDEQFVIIVLGGATLTPTGTPPTETPTLTPTNTDTP